MTDPTSGAPGLDVLVIGEALVDFVPLHRGPLRDTQGFELHSGGAPANVAIGVCRLGGRAGLVSVVGDDEFGAFLLASLRREGVDTRSVHCIEGVQTGLCFITLDRDGERSFLHRGGDPAAKLSAKHVEPEVAADARIVKFSSGPLRTAAGVQAVERMIQASRGFVAIDPGGCPEHWASPVVVAGRVRALLPRCDIIKCAESEARDLTGLDDPARAAAALVDRGCGLAVVTLGADGALFARRDDAGRVEAPRVEVVDTTGAGDAFMAALMFRLARDGVAPAEMERGRLIDHLRFACEVGARAVTRRGAIAGLPSAAV